MSFKKQIYDFMSVNSTINNEGELWIYGDIADEKWYDDDVTPVKIRDTLNEMGKVDTLNLRINSYGGSCMAGNAIVSIIDNYKRKNGTTVNAYIEGIAASMGSGIAMCADKIYMAENAIFMVHKPFSMAMGNSDDMKHEAEVLDKVEDTLVKNYMRHFNGTEEEMRQLMSDESWLTAEEALSYGLCDEIVEGVAVAASANGIRINGEDFKDNKLKNCFEKEVKVEMFEYDNSLNDYGIDEEKFTALNMESGKVLEIANSVVRVDEVAVQNAVENEHNMTIANIVERVGISEVDSIDKVIDLAIAGANIDKEMNSKAKSFDKIYGNAIDEAIKAGNRAKGESFNETKWRKLLNALDYEEILDQKNEWEAEAKIALKAGVKVSNGCAKYEVEKENNLAVNPDDYKIFS